MKKNYFLGIAASAVITMAGYLGFALTNQQEQLSDIQLANIEALASGEFIVGSGWECFEVVFDDVTNPQFLMVIKCEGCQTTSAVYVNTPNYCTLSGMYD